MITATLSAGTDGPDVAGKGDCDFYTQPIPGGRGGGDDDGTCSNHLRIDSDSSASPRASEIDPSPRVGISPGRGSKPRDHTLAAHRRTPTSSSDECSDAALARGYDAPGRLLQRLVEERMSYVRARQESLASTAAEDGEEENVEAKGDKADGNAKSRGDDAALGRRDGTNIRSSMTDAGAAGETLTPSSLEDSGLTFDYDEVAEEVAALSSVAWTSARSSTVSPSLDDAKQSRDDAGSVEDPTKQEGEDKSSSIEATGEAARKPETERSEEKSKSRGEGDNTLEEAAREAIAEALGLSSALVADKDGNTAPHTLAQHRRKDTNGDKSDATESDACLKAAHEAIHQAAAELRRGTGGWSASQQRRQSDRHRGGPSALLRGTRRQVMPLATASAVIAPCSSSANMIGSLADSEERKSPNATTSLRTAGTVGTADTAASTAAGRTDDKAIDGGGRASRGGRPAARKAVSFASRISTVRIVPDDGERWVENESSEREASASSPHQRPRDLFRDEDDPAGTDADSGGWHSSRDLKVSGRSFFPPAAAVDLEAGYRNQRGGGVPPLYSGAFEGAPGPHLNCRGGGHGHGHHLDHEQLQHHRHSLLLLTRRHGDSCQSSVSWSLKKSDEPSKKCSLAIGSACFGGCATDMPGWCRFLVLLCVLMAALLGGAVAAGVSIARSRAAAAAASAEISAYHVQGIDSGARNGTEAGSNATAATIAASKSLDNSTEPHPAPGRPAQMPQSASAGTALPSGGAGWTPERAMDALYPILLPGCGPTALLPTKHVDDEEATLSSLSSPQRQAMEWMAHSDAFAPALLVDATTNQSQTNGEETTTTRRERAGRRIVQRHALATLFFATSSHDEHGELGETRRWESAAGFLGEDVHECRWNEGTAMGAVERENLMEGEQQGKNGGGVASNMLGAYCLEGSDWVNVVQLTNNSLSGALPHELGLLSDLTTLDLCVNAIGGVLPPSLGNLQHLAHIRLQRNDIEGRIPAAWAGMPLDHLDLRHNMISSVPLELFAEGSVAGYSLRHLRLDGNRLTGLPNNMGTAKSLVRLGLGGNGLVGPLPGPLHDGWQALEELRLERNNFVGSIPLEYVFLKSLQVLDLSNNALSGIVPGIFSGHFEYLREVRLDGNSITGAVNFCHLPLLHSASSRVEGFIGSDSGTPAAVSPAFVADCRRPRTGEAAPAEIICGCCTECVR